MNDIDNLLIQDIMVEYRKDMLNIYLADGTRFLVHVENGAYVGYI